MIIARPRPIIHYLQRTDGGEMSGIGQIELIFLLRRIERELDLNEAGIIVAGDK